MKKIIPFGNLILVRREKIGKMAGSIVLPEEVQERATDLAVVVYTPDMTFADQQIQDNAQNIIEAQVKQAKEGNSYAVNTLMELNNYLKLKSIRVGDKIFISKYVGTDFHTSDSTEQLTLVKIDDIIGLVKE